MLVTWDTKINDISYLIIYSQYLKARRSLLYARLCRSLFKNLPLSSVFLRIIAKVITMAYMLRLPHAYLCDLVFYYSPCHSLAPATNASMLFFWIHQNSCLIAVPLAVHSTWNTLLQIAIMITASPPSDFAQMTTSWWSFACLIYPVTPLYLLYFVHEIYHLLTYYKIYLFCFSVSNH